MNGEVVFETDIPPVLLTGVCGIRDSATVQNAKHFGHVCEIGDFTIVRNAERFGHVCRTAFYNSLKVPLLDMFTERSSVTVWKLRFQTCLRNPRFRNRMKCISECEAFRYLAKSSISQDFAFQTWLGLFEKRSFSTVWKLRFQTWWN